MMGRSKQVLVVSNQPSRRRLIDDAVGADGFTSVLVSHFDQALQAAAQAQPEVIVLDLDALGKDALGQAMRFKIDHDVRFIPLILVAARSIPALRARGRDLGAQDFLTDPIDPDELRSALRAACRLRQMMELLENQARIDPLTSLDNRASLDDRLNEEWERAKRYDMSLALLMVDVDYFKSINDRFGHTFGDLTLAAVAETLRRLMRKIDLVARYGGEEFCIILPEQNLTGAIRVAERVRAGIEGLELYHDRQPVPLTVSVGVACVDQVHGEQPVDMIEVADRALYAAKQGGRNRVFFWDGHAVQPAPDALGGSEPPSRS